MEEGENYFDIAPDATIRAALLRNAATGLTDNFSITQNDLRKKVYQRPVQSLVVFVVDCSESMGDDGAYARIKAAKGAVLGILARAYQKRYRVCFISFREESAELILQPTSSLALAQRCLKSLPVGGTTPFADGLMKGWQLIKTERLKDPEISPLLVLLSDGETNVSYDRDLPQSEVLDELMLIGESIKKDNISSLVIETRPLRDPSPVMHSLSAAIGGRYHHISSFRRGDLLQAVTDIS